MKSVRLAILSLAAMVAMTGCYSSQAESLEPSPPQQKPKPEAPPPDASPPQQKPEPQTPPPSAGKQPSEKPKRLSKKEVLTFARKAYEAQNVLRQGTIPVETVRVTLAPWFTPEYIDHLSKRQDIRMEINGQTTPTTWKDT